MFTWLHDKEIKHYFAFGEISGCINRVAMFVGSPKG